MIRKIQNGILHCHIASVFDATSNPKKFVQTAFKLGCPAIALTDHGVLYGVEDFKDAVKEINDVIDACDGESCNKCEYKKRYTQADCPYKEMAQQFRKEGLHINAIPGVEAYYDEDEDVTKRAHLILIPKDYTGYAAISKAVTLSNTRVDSKGIPRMNMEILADLFATGKEGHGHVIATSACMAGILSNILLSNAYIQKSIDACEKKKKSLYNPNAPQYMKNIKEIDEIENRVKAMTEELKALEVIAKKPYKKKEKALEAAKNTSEYEEKKVALEAEKSESLAAAAKVQNLKDLCKKEKAKQKKIKERCKEEEKDHTKWNDLENKIAEYKSIIISDEDLYEKAKAQALTFERLFGKGNFYCELQNHRIDEEKKVMPIIAKIANELNIPVVAANDAHIPTNSEEDIKARQILRSLRFNKWELIHESDRELYIKTDEELASILSEILPTETVKKAMAGVKEIVDRCQVVRPKEAHYPKFTSDIPGETSDEALRRLAYQGIEWRFPGKIGWTETHQNRLEYELEVIQKMGYSDYHCIVQDFLDYGRLLGKLDMKNPDSRYLADPYNKAMLREITQDKVGLGVGPGRGSAVGSLVCYLIGITGVNPMNYDLLFERFLTPFRVSLPDIDSDFKRDIRNKVLDYVKFKYGEGSTCCIMTKGTQKPRAAIRNCARLLGSELYDDTKSFLSLGDEIAKSAPADPTASFADCWDELVTKFKDNKNAMTILNNARLVEGTMTNVGMHAAGVIVADNGDVKEYVPLMYNKEKEQWMAQCDMVQSEAIGLLKFDFLGLRNLDVITETLRLIQQRYGKSIDIETIPFEKAVFENVFATGNTNSVFQFESGGMKQMLRQFKPESIEDIILLVAAYRPGPMQYLDPIISVKHGRKKPDYIIPEMESVLGKTYGYPVFQEQIMQIFNKFAGFSLGESDIIRRYMSKKKTDKFMSYKEKFIDGLVSNGANANKAEAFWEQLISFSQYAFNSSHAAAYAHVAYYTAWLKYFYPKEYLCAVMNDTEFEKLSGLMGDCKRFGINVLPPDVNESAERFSIKNDAIFCGLGLVKNVGDSATAIIAEREKHGKFISFADFMTRTKARKDVVESLISAGAFDNFSRSRSALITAVPEYVGLIKKLVDKKQKLSETTPLLLCKQSMDEKTLKKTEASIARLEKSVVEIQHNIDSLAVNVDGDENQFVRLQAEKEMLGAYISGHPLDSYKRPEEMKCIPLGDIAPAYAIDVMGLVSNLRITQRKSDGAPLAFFSLEDLTGKVEVCCFTEAYRLFGHLLAEDAVIKVSGKCFEDEDSFTGESELKLNVKKISEIQEEKPIITLFVPSVMAWTDEIYAKIRPYQDKNGYPLVVYDKLFGKFRETGLLINKDILHNSIGLEASML